jgi:hypothetical protein
MKGRRLTGCVCTTGHEAGLKEGLVGEYRGDVGEKDGDCGLYRGGEVGENEGKVGE